jgi:cyclopropane fatty-acyl-phospholipid synthase-like methyltransferase
MTVSDPIRVVEDGYDQLGEAYLAWTTQMRGGPRVAFLERGLRLTPAGAEVLEIGCGPGTDAGALADGRRYTGIDLSSVQLEHARRSVPNATFVHADVLDVDLPPASFDAVLALYVFGHIPVDRTSELFERIATWLRRDGWLFASVAISDDPGSIEPAWLGVADMYFSSLPPERCDTLLIRAGFEIRSADTIEEVEPGEAPLTFRWMIARRTGAPAP